MKLKQLILFVIILLASCFASFSLFAQIPTSGLVAYWPMNGNYTNPINSALNGTNTASTASADKFGTANSAMNFSNPTSTVAQYATHPVHASTSFSGTQNFTITFLFYISTPWIQNGGLYDNCLNYGGYGIYIWKPGTNPNLQFNYKNGSVGSSQLTTGVWRHGAFVRNGGTLSIYINGMLNASASEGTMAPVYSYPARFGTMFYASYPHYNPLNGKLDEFRIYNRALSALEITQMASTTLPLVLTDLSAVKKPVGIQLNWETLSEQSTSHFEVERSNNATDFVSIGRVNAAGNSMDKKQYNFIDTRPLPGTNFYRLRMVDIDNKFTYSRVVAVKNNNDNLFTLQLFPNPVSDVLQVQVPSQQREVVTVSVSNTTGQVIYQRQWQVAEGNNAFSMPVAMFAPGQYYLTVQGSVSKQSLPFIKK